MTFSLEVEDKTGRVSETDGETDGLDCGDDNVGYSFIGDMVD